MPMAAAFSEYHSGDDAPTGRSEISTPSALAIRAHSCMMRALSTQLPRCSTGGIPRAPHRLCKPGPAMDAPSGTSRPALPAAVVTQPVASTIISFLISAFMSPTLAESCLILGLLQPTTPTKPRTVPALTASSKGSSVPPRASRMASLENPVMMLTGSTGISTRLGSRSTNASTAMRKILRASWRAVSGWKSKWIAPVKRAFEAVSIKRVW